MAAICWGSCNGDLVSEDPAKRPGCFENDEEGFGSGRRVGFRRASSTSRRSTDRRSWAIRKSAKILIDTLPKLGEIAVANKTAAHPRTAEPP